MEAEWSAQVKEHNAVWRRFGKEEERDDVVVPQCPIKVSSS